MAEKVPALSVLLNNKSGVLQYTRKVYSSTPLKLARRITGKRRVESIFAKDSILSIVDRSLSDKAFRMLALIRSLTFDGPAKLSYNSLAVGAGCTRKWAVITIERLESDGWIVVEREGQRNFYAVTDGPSAPAANGGRCVQCRVDRAWLTKAGVCMVCLKGADLDERVRQLVEAQPGIDEHVARALIRGEQDKRFRRAFERATAESA